MVLRGREEICVAQPCRLVEENATEKQSAWVVAPVLTLTERTTVGNFSHQFRKPVQSLHVYLEWMATLGPSHES